MAKKEIYEHISDIYFSDKNKRIYKKKDSQSILLYANTIVIAFLLIFTVFLALKLASAQHTRPGAFIVESTPGALSLLKNQRPLEFNYRLSIPKYSTDRFAIDLSERNIRGFANLVLTLKTKQVDPNRFIVILLETKTGDKGIYLLKGVNKNWKEFSIPFTDFQNLEDYGVISKLTFLFEDWNTDVKEDTLFVKDIVFNK